MNYLSYLIGLGILLIILTAVSLLAAWFGASMYKTGHRDGYKHAMEEGVEDVIHQYKQEAKHDD